MSKDGGQAFPSSKGSYPNYGSTDGMTLRDWFAGQMLAGAIACVHPFKIEAEKDAEMAAKAYAMADAMLAERGK